MESEVIALTFVGMETKWLENLFLDINLWLQPMPVIFLYCDSEVTMSKAFSDIYNRDQDMWYDMNT